MRKIVGIIVLLVGLSSYGQTGSLQVELENNYEEAEFEFIIFIGDSLIDSKNEESWQVIFDSLETAEYRLVVNSKESDKPTTYENIQVYSDSITTMFISVWEYSVCCATCDSVPYNRVEVLINLLYAPLLNQTSPYINNHLSVGIGGAGWLGLHKNFDIGGALGYYHERTLIDSTFSPKNVLPFEKQHYSNNGIALDVMGRIAFFDTKEWINGALIDVGVSYKIPVHFRYVTKSSENKVTQKKLHNFKDLNAFIKIGYSPVTVMLNYRIFDFVKNDFPQQPRWSAGLSFVILN